MWLRECIILAYALPLDSNKWATFAFDCTVESQLRTKIQVLAYLVYHRIQWIWETTHLNTKNCKFDKNDCISEHIATNLNEMHSVIPSLVWFASMHLKLTKISFGSQHLLTRTDPLCKSMRKDRQFWHNTSSKINKIFNGK